MTGDERWRVRLEAAGTDADEARGTLSSFYRGGSWATEPTDEPYWYRYAALGNPTMTLRTSRMQGYIEGDIPPGEDYIVQWLVSGRAVVDLGRDALAMVPGRPLLFPAHRPFVFGFADYDQRLVHLNRDHVAQVAAERLGEVSGRPRFDHTATPSGASVSLWHDVVALVSRSLDTGKPSPLLWHELTRMAAVAFLELYPPRPTPLPPSLLHPSKARLRAAVEYIHENAHLPVTPTELGRISDLRPRTLQEAFQRELGVPPLAYLRQVRLDRVREELEQLDPGVASVAAVAGRWGFAHLGRFAAAYAERFGEYPRETLGRRGGRAR